MPTATIRFFTQPGCPSCVTAKMFLSSRGVAFEEINIRRDAEALREMVEDLHSRVTPTVVFGSEIVLGFDAAKYEEALTRLGH